MTELVDGLPRGTNKSLDRAGITEQVIRRIKQLLITGELKAGSRLPSERELAERLDISRPSLRAALKALSVMGVIRSRPGSGTFIADSIPEVFTEPMHFLTLINRTSAGELFEARRIIEGGLAELAAQRAKSGDIATMRAAIESMERLRDDPAGLIEQDMSFHRALAQAAGNQLMSGVMETLTRLLYHKRLETVFNQKNVDGAIEGHRNIVGAIEAGDGFRAKQTVNLHLDDTLRNWEETQRVDLLPVAQAAGDSDGA